MIHHVSLGTNDVERARIFYDPVLRVLGMRCLSRDESSADYGSNTVIFSLETPTDGNPANPGIGAHVAFAAESRDMVCAFHQAALAHGGRDAGPPGVRAQYDPNYFGAFVLGPDGNKVEAVTYSAE